MIKYIAYYFREQYAYYGLGQHLHFIAFSSNPSKTVVYRLPKGVEKQCIWMIGAEGRI